MQVISVVCDGACSGNPGQGGKAFAIIQGDEAQVFSAKTGMTTNNQAELQAVKYALDKCLIYSNDVIDIITDSKNVVGWLTGTFKINVPAIKELVDEIKMIVAMSDFSDVCIRHISDPSIKIANLKVIHDAVDKAAKARSKEVM